MARRVSLPKADDLFRSTTLPDDAVDSAAIVTSTTALAATSQTNSGATSADGSAAPTAKRAAAQPAETDDNGTDGSAKAAKKPSGRVKHDAKMTVYITDDELLELEHARLSLRRSEGIIVDRGRLVREALSIVLADLEAKGAKSSLVKRLREK